MPINMIKINGGLFPFGDESIEEFSTYSSNCGYPVDIKRGRNPAFHKKMIMFFKFCMEHWREEFYPPNFHLMSAKEQFDNFRYTMTILAGYYETTFPASLTASDFPTGIFDMQKNKEYGYYEYVPSAELQRYTIIKAQSISYNSMSEKKFRRLYNRLINVAMESIFKDLTLGSPEHQNTQNQLLSFF